MGFYIQLKPAAGAKEFAEEGMASVYWILYAFTGFALSCMGAAAYTFLADLMRVGSTWDAYLVFLILAAIPLYLLIGLRMAGWRKFVRWDEANLFIGYRLWGRTLWQRKWSRAEITGIDMFNQSRGGNLAPDLHDNQKYYLKGHWCVELKLKKGKSVFLDKHTHREVLLPLQKQLSQWLNSVQPGNVHLG